MLKGRVSSRRCEYAEFEEYRPICRTPESRCVVSFNFAFIVGHSHHAIYLSITMPMGLLSRFPSHRTDDMLLRIRSWMDEWGKWLIGVGA